MAVNHDTCVNGAVNGVNVADAAASVDLLIETGE